MTSFKPIAILSCNLERTIEWAVNTLGVNRIDMSARRLVKANEHGDHLATYIIIQSNEEALSWEFRKYLMAPDYFTLEDTVKERIR